LLCIVGTHGYLLPMVVDILILVYKRDVGIILYVPVGIREPQKLKLKFNLYCIKVSLIKLKFNLYFIRLNIIKIKI